MRWKLLIAASVLSTVVGAGASILLLRFLPRSSQHVLEPGWAASAAIVLPLAAMIFASVFVYRHTAKRRTLQAITTALLAVILMSATLLVSFQFSVFGFQFSVSSENDFRRR